MNVRRAGVVGVLMGGLLACRNGPAPDRSESMPLASDSSSAGLRKPLLARSASARPAVASASQSARSWPSPRASSPPRALTKAEQDESDAILYPLNAYAPGSFYRPTSEPLGATEAQLHELVVRFARAHGHTLDTKTVAQIFKDSPATPAGPPTPWGKLCREIGLIHDEPLSMLCQYGTPESPVVLWADFDGDGSEDYVVFTTNRYGDLLRAVYARQGEGLKQMPLPQEPPFDPGTGPTHNYSSGSGPGMLSKTASGLTVFDINTTVVLDERPDSKTLGQPVRREIKRNVYVLEKGRPRFLRSESETETLSNGSWKAGPTQTSTAPYVTAPPTKPSPTSVK